MATTPKIEPLPCPFCGTIPKFSRIPASLARPEIDKAFWTLSCGKKSNCLIHAMAHGDTKAEAVRDWNNRVSSDVFQHPITTKEKAPFIARCGRVLMLVEELDNSIAPKFILLRGTLLEGKHFSDHGDFLPGDKVTIGPITDHWRRISLV